MYKNVNIEHLAVAEHSFLTKHFIDFDEADILANSTKFIMKEKLWKQ